MTAPTYAVTEQTGEHTFTVESSDGTVYSADITAPGGYTQLRITPDPVGSYWTFCMIHDAIQVYPWAPRGTFAA